jgi:hypothetical protein
MPSTVQQADSQYALDWSKWPVPTMPDLKVVPWGNIDSFWQHDLLSEPVDTERTNALSLSDYDLPIDADAGNAPWEGVSYGMPFNIINNATPLTKVWDMSRPITWNWFTPKFPITRVPLPNLVRRGGDPTNSFDMHCIAWNEESKILWEAIVLNSSPFNRLKTFGQCDWVCGYDGGGRGIERWDCNKPWDAPGQPMGVVAANVPKFPLVARWEEIQKGRIDHMIFAVLPNYAPEKVGYARGTDGDWVGHPCRAGERLRLKAEVVQRFAPGTAARIVAQALHEFGMMIGDRTRGKGARTGPAGIELTQDRRWDQGDGNIGPIGRMGLMLSDFEVIAQ